MAYETEVENVKEYYADLLILQYRSKPRARATIKLGAELYLADGLVFQLNDCLNIDTAVGAQLDLIGKILGCSRNIPGLTLRDDFFSFENKTEFTVATYADLPETAVTNDVARVITDETHDDNTTYYQWLNGAWTYQGETNPIDVYGYSDKNALSDGYFKSYWNSTGSIYSLQDNDYRSLLKFKAAYNLRRGSWGDMNDLYYRMFGTDLQMVNNKNLSVTYNVSANLSTSLRAAIYLNYIQPPMGINYTINYV